MSDEVEKAKRHLFIFMPRSSCTLVAVEAIEALIDAKIKEALEPKQCDHKRIFRDPSGKEPDTCAFCMKTVFNRNG